ncbi:unnamed protein product, partial [Mesorhabditis belari]|uniref:GrpE protein homolog n=1 Tax=Mesorhabditis belari TaxID=2138241 RepID=A0AAF3FAQ4_9BILA
MFLRALSRLSGIIPSTIEARGSAQFTKTLSTRHQSTNATGSEEQKNLDLPLTDNGKRISGENYLANVRKAFENGDKDEWALPAKNVLSLISEYDVLINESADFKDKYQRALAEMENVRRRGVKQVDDAKTFAIQGFCKDLLEVADILDLAMGSIKKEDLDEGGKQLQDIYEGISMTKRVLLKIFDKHGLTAVDPMGTKFDPNLHEAITQIPAKSVNVEPGNIAFVSKIGYSLKGRPIRAAQVGVAID